MRCWGGNGLSQVDRFGGPDVFVPFKPFNSQVLMALAGGDFSCAIELDGNVLCWGWNDGSNGFQAKAEGAVHMSGRRRGGCAALGREGVACWTKDATTAVAGIDNAVMVAYGGTSHTCASDEYGAVFCWGRNQFGELGHGPLTFAAVPPTGVDGLSD